MELIGAGFPRTGTMSTKIALEQLGFGPCYHFSSLFERPQDIDVWQMVADGNLIDWRALFADFHSAVDWPASIFYKQLMEEYPTAKVLLTIRNPDAWYESVLHTVYAIARADLSTSENSARGNPGRMVDTLGWQRLFHGRFEDKPYAISIFEQHNQEVMDTVPVNRLLIWEVKEGWEPLCRFLGVAVPDMPFPHVNSAEEFNQRLSQRDQGHHD